MIGHRSRFRENDDLPLRRGPVVKKKQTFSNARALITHKIMRSRDAQCNTAISYPISFPESTCLLLLNFDTTVLSKPDFDFPSFSSAY